MSRYTASIYLVLFAWASSMVLGASFTFNSSTTLCDPTKGGCSINDPEIYNEHQVPGKADTVYFNVTEPDTSVYIIVSNASQFWVSYLFMVGSISLEVQNNCTITADVANISGVTINVLQNGVFLLGSNSYFQNSVLELYGKFEHGFKKLEYGTTYFLSQDSTVHAYAGSVFILYAFYCNILGSLTFDKNSSFSSQWITNFTQAGLHFEIMPFVGSASFYDMTASFSEGLDAKAIGLHGSEVAIYESFGSSEVLFAIYVDSLSELYFRNAQVQFGESITIGGNGIVAIWDSSVVAEFNSPIACNLVFIGKSVLTFSTKGSGTILSPDKVQFGEGPNDGYVSFVLVGGYFNLVGTWTILGDITINNGTLNVAGNVTFTGSLSAVSGFQVAEVFVNGYLSCASIQLDHYGSYSESHALTSLFSTISAPSIQVNGNFSIFTLRTTRFVGDFINNGSVFASEQDNINIQGNYTQLSGARFVAYDLAYEFRDVPNINVNGSASIEGSLEYNISYAPPNEANYSVVAAQSISGKFSRNVLHGDDFESEIVVSVETSSVVITIKPPSSPDTYKILGLDWWVWVIIGVVLQLLVIGVIIAVVKKRRVIVAVVTRRRGYDPVLH